MNKMFQVFLYEARYIVSFLLRSASTQEISDSLGSTKHTAFPSSQSIRVFKAQGRRGTCSPPPQIFANTLIRDEKCPFYRS